MNKAFAWIVSSFNRLFNVSGKDVERLMNRCELIGQDCPREKQAIIPEGK